MKLALIKKVGIGLAITMTLSTLASVIWANDQLDRMYGGKTTRVKSSLFEPTKGKIIIRNVSVLSPEADSMLPNRTVMLANGKIISIDTTFQEGISTEIIDGTGKYLIPGLTDTHIHLWKSQNDLLLYLANGVTHVWELMSLYPKHLKWRQEIEEGTRLGPKLLVASNKLKSFDYLEGKFHQWSQGTILVNEASEAPEVISSIMDGGYDAVKIGTFLNRESYIAVNQAAAEKGIPVIGHIPLDITLDDLWNSHQSEVAHIEEFVKHINKEFGWYSSKTAEEFLELVEERSEEIAQKLIERNISVTPTLWLMESFPKQKFTLRTALSQIRLSYANTGLVEGTPMAKRALGWVPGRNTYERQDITDPERKKGILIYWETYAEACRILLRVMAEEGVQIMAGTDANVPIAVPGFSLHDELVSMNNAGMTPTQVLRSTTTNPANWLGLKSGKILPDYRADLVLLENNPLENISHTTSIEAVFAKGAYFDREMLDAMMESVKQANQGSKKM
ncbi:MAG: amidohydrolase family protein [Bacteroidota bacterium]